MQDNQNESGIQETTEMLKLILGCGQPHIHEMLKLILWCGQPNVKILGQSSPPPGPLNIMDYVQCFIVIFVMFVAFDI